MAPRRTTKDSQPPVDVSYDSEETGGCCPFFLKGRRKTRSRQPQPSPAQNSNTRMSTTPTEHVTEVKLPVDSGDSTGDEPLDSVATGETTSPTAVDSARVKPQISQTSSPEMSINKTPTTRKKQQAQEKFKIAAVKLEVAMSKAIAELQIPEATELQQFENMDDVLKMAKVLESVMDKIDDALTAQKENRSRVQQAKDTAQVWLNASFSSIKTGLNAVQVLSNFI